MSKMLTIFFKKKFMLIITIICILAITICVYLLNKKDDLEELLIVFRNDIDDVKPAIIGILVGIASSVILIIILN